MTKKKHSKEAADLSGETIRSASNSILAWAIASWSTYLAGLGKTGSGGLFDQSLEAAAVFTVGRDQVIIIASSTDNRWWIELDNIEQSVAISASDKFTPTIISCAFLTKRITRRIDFVRSKKRVWFIEMQWSARTMWPLEENEKKSEIFQRRMIHVDRSSFVSA